MATDSRKKSVYLPAPILDQLEAAAKRTDRSLSWLVQFAVKASLSKISELPSARGYGEDEDPRTSPPTIAP